MNPYEVPKEERTFVVSVVSDFAEKMPFPQDRFCEEFKNLITQLSEFRADGMVTEGTLLGVAYIALSTMNSELARYVEIPSDAESPERLAAREFVYQYFTEEQVTWIRHGRFPVMKGEIPEFPPCDEWEQEDPDLVFSEAEGLTIAANLLTAGLRHRTARLEKEFERSEEERRRREKENQKLAEIICDQEGQ